MTERFVMNKNTITKAAVVAVGLAEALWATGQIIDINSAVSFTYTQAFNTLAISGSGNPWTDNSTIPGWWWDSNNAARNPDVYGYIADAGTDITGAGHSYGAMGSNERAMGALSSTGTDISFGVQFRNTSGSAIPLSNILISYMGEQWRRQTAQQTLAFSYQISASLIPNTLTGSWTPQSALNFTGPQTGAAGAIDGNAAANRVIFSDVPLASVGSLNHGDHLMLRWYKTGTSSPGLAVDDFQLTVVPEPTSVAMLGLGALAARFARRRRV